MVIVKNVQIQQIPVFEVYQEGQAEEQLPLIIFYHGWESRKERVLEYGYTLAKSGFRVVLPEAWNHGERKATYGKEQDALDFWEVVVQNVRELPLISNYYISNHKAVAKKISVAGLSMGGITVSALLTQYDWIHAAAVLMGSPAPIAFSKWLLQNYTIEGTALYDLLDKEEVEKKLMKLKAISLTRQPEKIANRPVYFWHGTEDPIVPMHLTRKFLEEIQAASFSEQVEFEFTKGAAHEVPREIILKTADFFKRTGK